MPVQGIRDHLRSPSARPTVEPAGVYGRDVNLNKRSLARAHIFAAVHSLQRTSVLCRRLWVYHILTMFQHRQELTWLRCEGANRGIYQASIVKLRRPKH